MLLLLLQQQLLLLVLLPPPRRLYVFAFVCLSLDRITQKAADEFWWNFWRGGMFDQQESTRSGSRWDPGIFKGIFQLRDLVIAELYLRRAQRPWRRFGISDCFLMLLLLLLQCVLAVDICKRRILYLSLPSIPPDFSDADRLLFMSSLVPFDNICMVV